MAQKKRTRQKQPTSFNDLVTYYQQLADAEPSAWHLDAHRQFSYYLARLGEGDAARESAFNVLETSDTVRALAQISVLLPTTQVGRDALASARKIAKKGLLKKVTAPSSSCYVATLVHLELGAAEAAMGRTAVAQGHLEQATAPGEPSSPASGQHTAPAHIVVALTRAGLAEKACAILERCEHLPQSIGDALQILFEEERTEGALQLLATLQRRWGIGHDGELIGAAARTLAKAGRYEEAFDLLDSPTITFSCDPLRLEILETQAALGADGKTAAIKRLEDLLAAEEDSNKAYYLLALSKLEPQRALATLPEQIAEVAQRASWFGQEVARAAARLNQPEAILAIDDGLANPHTRIAIRAGLAAEHHDITNNVEAALALIADDGAMGYGFQTAVDSRREALLGLASALYAADKSKATELFERVRDTILQSSGSEKNSHLRDLVQAQSEVGDLDGALMSLMKLSPARRCDANRPLLYAYADRGDLDGVLTVAKKLGGARRDRERAEAVAIGFCRAARLATCGWAEGPYGGWP